jgi:hypothetical protein
MDRGNQAGDIEALARMAARLAGRDPDEYVQLKMAGIVAFDGSMWRYPDFLARGEAAYEALTKACLERPISLNGIDYPSATGGAIDRSSQAKDQSDV